MPNDHSDASALSADASLESVGFARVQSNEVGVKRSEGVEGLAWQQDGFPSPLATDDSLRENDSVEKVKKQTGTKSLQAVEHENESCVGSASMQTEWSVACLAPDAVLADTARAHRSALSSTAYDFWGYRKPAPIKYTVLTDIPTSTECDFSAATVATSIRPVQHKTLATIERQAVRSQLRQARHSSTWQRGSSMSSNSTAGNWDVPHNWIVQRRPNDGAPGGRSNETYTQFCDSCDLLYLDKLNYVRPCQSSHCDQHGEPLPRMCAAPDQTITVRFWCGKTKSAGWVANRFIRMRPALTDTHVTDDWFKSCVLHDVSQTGTRKLLATPNASDTTAAQNRVFFTGKQPVLYDESTSVHVSTEDLRSDQLPPSLGEVPIHKGFVFKQT